MKKQVWFVLSLVLVAILALSACGTKTEAPVVEDGTEMLSDAEMEALITEKIEDEHTLEFILSQDFTAEEWSDTLDRMISYGAEISPAEKELIIEWLVNRK